jgi:hypothetical protein
MTKELERDFRLLFPAVQGFNSHKQTTRQIHINTLESQFIYSLKEGINDFL